MVVAAVQKPLSKSHFAARSAKCRRLKKRHRKWVDPEFYDQNYQKS
jgi:hypothetical protein